jgi:hypothetical protein
MPKRQYVFSASGAQSVMAAFRGIGKSATNSARKVKQSADQMRAATAALARGSGGRRYVLSDPNQLRKESRARRAALRKQYDQEAQDHRRHLEKQAKHERMHLEKQAKHEHRINQRMARSRARAFGNAARVAGRVGLYAAGTAIGALTGIVGKGARQSVELQDISTRLAIKGSGDGTRLDPTRLRRGFEGTARKWRGVEAADMAGATGAFVERTGRLDVAQSMQDIFAEFTLATGTAGEDLGRVAADLFEKFDVKTIDDMRKALATLAIQGKRGAFEIQDAAAQFPRMAAAAGTFGLPSGVKGVAQLGALSQAARKSTGSGAMAATAVENMLSNIKNKPDQIKRDLGVDVYTDKSRTQTRDIEDIIVDMVTGTKGDKSKMKTLLGKRGDRAIAHFLNVFNKAIMSGKNMSEASEAVRAEFKNLEAAAGAEAEIKKDAALAQTMTSTTLTGAWEELKAAIGQDLTPALTSLAKNFSRIVTDTDAVENLMKAFVALADGAEGAIQGLEYLGFLKPKSTSQRLGETQQELRAQLDVASRSRAEFFGTTQEGADKMSKYRGYMDMEEGMRRRSGGKLTKEDELRLRNRMANDDNFFSTYEEYKKGSQLLRNEEMLAGATSGISGLRGVAKSEEDRAAKGEYSWRRAIIAGGSPAGHVAAIAGLGGEAVVNATRTQGQAASEIGQMGVPGVAKANAEANATAVATMTSAMTAAAEAIAAIDWNALGNKANLLGGPN